MRKRIGFLAVVLGLSLCMLVPTLYAAGSNPGVIQACIEHGNKQIYVVEEGEFCKKHDTPIQLSTSASGGGGGTLVFNKRWNDKSSFGSFAWHTIIGSEVGAIVGGGPLLVQMNVSLSYGGHRTCRPVIIETVSGGSVVQWLGDYSSQTKPYSDPFWTEGWTSSYSPIMWATSKIYTDVPAGTHTFALQCATDSSFVEVNDGYSLFSSWSVTELK